MDSQLFIQLNNKNLPGAKFKIGQKVLHGDKVTEITAIEDASILDGRYLYFTNIKAGYRMFERTGTLIPYCDWELDPAVSWKAYFKYMDNNFYRNIVVILAFAPVYLAAMYLISGFPPSWHSFGLYYLISFFLNVIIETIRYYISVK